MRWGKGARWTKWDSQVGKNGRKEMSRRERLFLWDKKSGKRLTRSRQIDQKAEIEEGGRALSAEEHFLS